MKNWKVRTKLFFSFGVILLLFVMSITSGSLSMQRIKKNVTTFYDAPYRIQANANAIKVNLEDLQKTLYRSMTTKDEQVNQSVRAEVNSIMKDTAAQLESIRQHAQGDLSILEELNKSRESLEAYRDQVLNLSMQNQNDAALALMESSFLASADDFAAKLDKLIEAVNASGDTMIQGIGQAQSVSLTILISMCAVSVVLSIILCLYITRMITRPLSEIRAAAYEMSQGKLKVQIHYHSRDELGQVSDNMRQTVSALDRYVSEITRVMRELEHQNFDLVPEVTYQGDFVPLEKSVTVVLQTMSRILGQINAVADQVAMGSDQVSSGAQALSQGATEQASSVEELAATIGGVSSQVRDNARSAQQASDKAGLVGREMEESGRKMQEMIGAMSEISGSSREIGKIIKTIEDIAFQTNILALNAAVEAARAGAAGKGFAVVADEVRNLANKSSEASRNTSALIEESIRAVENGTRIAGETAQSLAAAVDGAREVAENADRISTATRTQAESIEQVTLGMDQISSVVQTNSATAQESAATSEELSGQAQVLKTLVSGFRLMGVSAEEPAMISAGGKY